MQSTLSKIALTVVAGAVITAGTAGTAFADQPGAWVAKGRVTANGGLYERERPSTGSRVVGWNARGSVVGLKCKVKGERVDGNSVWYQLSDGHWGYSSARYIENVGRSPEWCKN